MPMKPVGSFQDGVGKIIQQIASLGMTSDSTPDDVAFIQNLQNQCLEYVKSRGSNPDPQGQGQGMMGGMGMPQQAGPSPMGGPMMGLQPKIADMDSIRRMLGGQSSMQGA